jgi:hypothetical protein
MGMLALKRLMSTQSERRRRQFRARGKARLALVLVVEHIITARSCSDATTLKKISFFYRVCCLLSFFCVAKGAGWLMLFDHTNLESLLAGLRGFFLLLFE